MCWFFYFIGVKDNLMDAPGTGSAILNIFKITGMTIKYALRMFFCGLLSCASMVIQVFQYSTITVMPML
jgi:hypothetical protein